MMDSIIYTFGIVFIILILGTFGGFFIETVCILFHKILNYWEDSNKFKKIEDKARLKKLACAAKALEYWSWAYTETKDMNPEQLSEYYSGKYLNEKKAKTTEKHGNK